MCGFWTIIRNPCDRSTHLLTSEQLVSSTIMHTQSEQMCMFIYSFVYMFYLDPAGFKKYTPDTIVNYFFVLPHDW